MTATSDNGPSVLDHFGLGSGQVVSNLQGPGGGVGQFGSIVETPPPASTDPRVSTAQTITIDPGTRIEKVLLTIRARPPNSISNSTSNPTLIRQVAEVRKTTQGVVLDFGRMRTVSGLDLGAGVDPGGVHPWLGAAYGPNVGLDEVMTERLLLTGSKVDPDKVKSTGKVTLPGAPADLEVIVAGKRIFFQSGEAKRAALGTTMAKDDYFVAAIDATDAVRTAAAINPSVLVELRAATAGILALAIQLTRTRIHGVVFPEGKERVVSFASEGTATLEVPLPSDSKDSWRVVGVHMKVTSKLGVQRITPAIGPAASTDVELSLDAEHPVALQITPAELESFDAIDGVRIQVRVAEGTAEIAGVLLANVLLADASGAPGEPLPGGALAPLQVKAEPGFTWQTLTLRKTLRLPGGPLWLALQVGHGRLAMKLAASGGGAIRRGRPGGPWQGFSTGIAVTPRAALRVVGEGREGATMYALAAGLPNALHVASVPTAEGAELTLVPSNPIRAAKTLKIALTAIAPGAYRFGNVQIFYRLPGDTPA